MVRLWNLTRLVARWRRLVIVVRRNTSCHLDFVLDAWQSLDSIFNNNINFIREIAKKTSAVAAYEIKYLCSQH
jgi:hypothetical protein